MKFTKYFSPKLALLMTALACTTQAQVADFFFKVGGNIVKNECLLTTAVTASTRPRVACSSLCLQKVNCHFFCIRNGNGLCALFKAFVAVRWPGHPASASTTTYDACYTSWGDPRDIVKTNSHFTYSSVWGSLDPKSATDGYACAAPAFFATQSQPNSFTQIDMELTTRVQTVIIATTLGSEMANMDVILSNTSDYNLGQKIGRVDGAPPHWSTCTIVTNTSVAGRYITTFWAATGYHSYAEIQVVPLP
ncbi:uncharacterized protein LOC125178896 [Hyalella azteca]|uniref:Uncharacterized protein LOC125178896 n=1 Tax=Hyalella azteca TaxID=294128 RepID=A0A979FU95_HYAAZ|nr:uncharacterized protein LOC125178896 [Hyalella azteca]